MRSGERYFWGPRPESRSPGVLGVGDRKIAGVLHFSKRGSCQSSEPLVVCVAPFADFFYDLQCEEIGIARLTESVGLMWWTIRLLWLSQPARATSGRTRCVGPIARNSTDCAGACFGSKGRPRVGMVFFASLTSLGLQGCSLRETDEREGEAWEGRSRSCCRCCCCRGGKGPRCMARAAVVIGRMSPVTKNLLGIEAEG